MDLLFEVFAQIYERGYILLMDGGSHHLKGSRHAAVAPSPGELADAELTPLPTPISRHLAFVSDSLLGIIRRNS